MSPINVVSFGLFALFVGAAASKQEASPAQKVVELLKKFQAELTAESEKEAAEFKEYTRFCAKSKDEKEYQIGRSEKEIAEMQADIGVWTQDLKVLEEVLSTLAEDTASFEAQLQKATATRAEEASNYSASAKTMVDAIAALTSAMKVISASKSQAGLAQLTATASRVLSSASKVSLLQLSDDEINMLEALGEPSVSAPSSDIVAMLNGLKTSFVKNKHELDMEEENNKFTFNKVQLNMTQMLKFAKEDTDEKTTTKIDKEGKAAQTKKDLSAENASMISDQAFLAELTKTCADKQKAAEERKTARDGELKALAKAIEELGGGSSLLQVKAAEKPIRNYLRSRPKASSFPLKQDEAASMDKLLAAEAGRMASAPQVRASFLQLRGGRTKASSLKSKFAKLEEMSSRVKNSQFALAVLQLRAANGTNGKDPYVEIRKVIQNLVQTMEDTVANRSSVKSTCDEIEAKNNEAKAASQSEIDGLLMEIESEEAFLSKTTKQVAELEKDISELKENLAEAEKLRSEEKASNEASIKEAADGFLAATNAKSTLSAYYGASSSKVNIGLVQVSQPDVVTGDYKDEAAARSSGILGMLDVVISDFENTKTKTEAEEKKAASDHKEFVSKSDTDTKNKERDVSAKKYQIKSQNDSLAENKEKLEEQEQINLGAKQALEESKNMCDQDSYEQRKEERDANISSLKQILSDLEDLIASSPAQ
eukprot:TRINITY_DN3533_c0_g2_i1.p1 TRINITY_DN3533_c0_g2~~TRINITY_DN3533_c0_g2_i1.p1  ORF type:complete len:711 (-),score=222.16 TRINITY_DN3533_c0_g2_i1:29-2161(-)